MLAFVQSSISEQSHLFLTFCLTEAASVLSFCGKQDALDSIEVYNTETEKWETIDIKLKEPKHSFGFMTLKLSDIISQLS